MSTNNTKQATWIAIGSFFSYVVGIVSPMILSRFFDKGDYGTYRQVMYVYNTLLIVFTFGLPRAYSYFIPKREIEQSWSIISKLNRLFLLLGGIFSLSLFVFAEPISKALNNEELVVALRYFSPVPVLLLPTMGLEGIFASFKKTEFLALFTITTRVLTIACTIIPVVCFSGSYIEAIIGFDFAALITCIFAFVFMKLPLKGVQTKPTDISYRQVFYFALPLLFASLWGMIIESAPQYFIGHYYGTEVFADFSNGFFRIPFVGMVISAIAAILLPEFSRIDQGNGMGEEASRIWMSSIIKSAKIIFPMLVYGVFFPKLIMTCMYGDIYESSSIYFIVKNVSGLFFILPFAPIMIAIGKTKKYAMLHFVTAIGIVVLEIIAVNVINTPVAVAIVSEICQVVFVFLMMHAISKFLNKSIRVLIPIKDLLFILAASSISGLLAYSICILINLNKFVLLGISLCLFVLIYYICCWIMSISYKEIVKGFLSPSKAVRLNRFIP